MSARKSTTKPPKENEFALQKKQNIPVQLTDLSIFDNAYSFMKERFAEEMKRIDQQMNQFSSNMTRFYGQSTTVQSGLISSRHDNMTSNWDDLTNSPLVQGEGDEKTLKLQFDVSQFEPTEIKVKLLNNMLVVAATHEEKTNGSTVYREYNREFLLPPDTDPDLVISSLSRDGVLTVQAPLIQPENKDIPGQKQIRQ